MFSKNTEVILSEELVKEAYEVGRQRHLSNRKNGVHNLQVARVNPYVIDGEGVCGEFAFAQMVNAPKLEWDRIKEISPRSAEKDLGDVAYNHIQFDVKATKYATGHLIVSRGKIEYLAQAYALFTGFYGEYLFRGVISRERILKNINNIRKDKGTGALWIPQSMLSDLPS